MTGTVVRDTGGEEPTELQFGDFRIDVRQAPSLEAAIAAFETALDIVPDYADAVVGAAEFFQHAAIRLRWSNRVRKPKSSAQKQNRPRWGRFVSGGGASPLRRILSSKINDTFGSGRTQVSKLIVMFL
jgi:hypothetical protein